MNIIDYLRLIRFPNDLIVGIGVIIGELVAARSIPLFSHMVIGFLVGFLISASVMIINDVADLEIDKINNPNKPLVKGAMSPRHAIIHAIVYGGLGVILSFFNTIYNFLVAIIFWFVGISYNFYFKKKGLIGNMFVSMSVAIPFIYGNMIIGNIDSNVIILSAAAFLTNTFREIIKGIIDIKGDKSFNVKTLAVTYGPRKAYYISLPFLASAIIVSIIPFIYNSLPNMVNYSIFITFTDLTLIISGVLPLLKNLSSSSLLLSKRICLGGMFLGMLSFIAGIF